MQIEEIKKEAEKTWNFHNSHDKMTSQPKGVMAVSEAKKLFDKVCELIESQPQFHFVLNPNDFPDGDTNLE